MSHLFKKKAEQEEAQIDLTPMLDVVFIMLIFFIVTASFVSESGFNVSRPPPGSDNPDTPPNQRNAVFVVTADNQIWLDGRRIDVRSVRANVERILAENPKAQVIVRAAENSDANTYVQITDQAKEAVKDPNFSADLVTYSN